MNKYDGIEPTSLWRLVGILKWGYHGIFMGVCNQFDMEFMFVRENCEFTPKLWQTEFRRWWVPMTLGVSQFSDKAAGCFDFNILVILSVCYCILIFIKTQMPLALDNLPFAFPLYMPQGTKFWVRSPSGESFINLSCFLLLGWAQECAYRIAWRSIWRKVPVLWRGGFSGRNCHLGVFPKQYCMLNFFLHLSPSLSHYMYTWVG